MLSKDYVVGLTDGEGSFTVYIRPPKKEHGSKSYRVECHYYVKLREDDLPLLKKVKEFFKVGRISFQKETRPNHQDSYRYEVTNLKEISDVIIPFFDKNLLQSKRLIDYKLFKRIVKATLNKKHQKNSGLHKIKQWKSKMHKFRAR